MKVPQLSVVVSLLLIQHQTGITFSTDPDGIFFTEELKLAPKTTIIGERKTDYEQFLGIPFAKPPLGDLRFRSPQRTPLWTGNRISTNQVKQCWQFDPQSDTPASGTEDCLYLNLYRPRNPKRIPLQVVVYLHGGGFHSGTTSPTYYGPEYFMETGEVILVIPAYRLNVFGFLSIGEKTLPGNYGLKDQTMALKWIRDHVSAFGGDPNNVTLMGHEAGAVSVNYHLISRHSAGLFHRAIMFSGMANMPWTRPLENSRNLVNDHARALGINKPELMSSQSLGDTLRSIPALNLTEALRNLPIWKSVAVTSYLPDVEVEWLKDPFLTVDPEVAMKEGNFQNIPIMSTIVPGDGLHFAHGLLRAKDRLKHLNENIETALPEFLRIDPNHKQMKEIVDKIRFQYFGPTGLLTDDADKKILSLSSDYFFKWPYYKNMQRMTSASEQPVFGHLFNYRGLHSFSSLVLNPNEDYGVVHGDDQMYLFRIGDAFPVQLGPVDILAKNFFFKYVMNFIRSGSPGYERWRTLSPELATTVNYNGTATSIGLLMTVPEEYKFWDKIENLLLLD